MSDAIIKVNSERFVELVRKCGLVDEEAIPRVVVSVKDALTGKVTENPREIADAFVRERLLTRWQADLLLRGKHKGFWLGRYRLVSILGTGGMSTVYLAEHTLMKRQVAIKILPHSKVADSSYLARFRREAAAVAQLDHPNIVRAYDIDHEGKTHYFVMEYVEGPDFLQIVDKDGPLEYRRAAGYITQVAEGLQHAHDAGLIHRDVKPANCLVDGNEVVKLLDLGLALFLEEEGPSLTLAHDENVLGTADYLAPEQAISSHHVDSRADIYSLGCTLYFLLTGHPPFPTGTMSERLVKHQKETPKDIKLVRPDAPTELVETCNAMMVKSRRRRIQTCREVADRLRAWLDQRTKRLANAKSGAETAIKDAERRESQAGAKENTASTAARTPPPSPRVSQSGEAARAGAQRRQATKTPTPNPSPEDGGGGDRRGLKPSPKDGGGEDRMRPKPSPEDGGGGDRSGANLAPEDGGGGDRMGFKPSPEDEGGGARIALKAPTPTTTPNETTPRTRDDGPSSSAPPQPPSPQTPQQTVAPQPDDDWDDLLGSDHQVGAPALPMHTSRRSSGSLPAWIWILVAAGVVIVALAMIAFNR